MNRFTRAVAMASARHPWRTMTGWMLVLATVLLLAATGGGTFVDDFSARGSESERASALLADEFPDAALGSALVVLAADEGATLESQRAGVDSVLADVSGLDHVATVTDPFTTGTVSPDGRIGYARITLDVPEREMGKPAFAEPGRLRLGHGRAAASGSSSAATPSSSTPRPTARGTSASACWSP